MKGYKIPPCVKGGAACGEGIVKSDFRFVADYFVQMQETGDYVPGPDSIAHINAVLNLLSVMTGDKRFEEAAEGCNKREGEVKNMCEVLDRIEQRGISIGEARGISIGEARGISIGESRGISQGFVNAIAIWLKNGGSEEMAGKLFNASLEQVSKAKAICEKELIN